MHTPGGEETPLGPADDGGVPNYESKKYFAEKDKLFSE
jgi:hypothetical protein